MIESENINYNFKYETARNDPRNILSSAKNHMGNEKRKRIRKREKKGKMTDLAGGTVRTCQSVLLARPRLLHLLARADGFHLAF